LPEAEKGFGCIPQFYSQGKGHEGSRDFNVNYDKGGHDPSEYFGYI